MERNRRYKPSTIAMPIAASDAAMAGKPYRTVATGTLASGTPSFAYPAPVGQPVTHLRERMPKIMMIPIP